MTKTFQEVSKELSLLINLALASAKVRKLTLTEPNCLKSIRPQIHVLLMAESGSTKSTILEQISNAVNCMPAATNMTAAGLIGTVDSSTKQVIPAYGWECRNSLMLIDEFKISRKENDALDPLLQLLEHGRYNKKFGLLSYATPVKDNMGNYFRVKDGKLELKSQFAAIFATMRILEHSERPEVQALISRCIPYKIKSSYELVENIAQGTPLYVYSEFAAPKEVTIQLDDYLKIMSVVRSTNIDPKVYLRAIGDCCRVFAILGQHDEGLYHLICQLKQASLDEHKAFLEWKYSGKKKRSDKDGSLEKSGWRRV